MLRIGYWGLYLSLPITSGTSVKSFLFTIVPEQLCAVTIQLFFSTNFTNCMVCVVELVESRLPSMFQRANSTSSTESGGHGSLAAHSVGVGKCYAYDVGWCLPLTEHGFTRVIW